MWKFQSEELPDGRGMRFELWCEGRPASANRVLEAWQDDDAFRSQFRSQLAAVPYVAFRWETPPLTPGTLDAPWEFVVLNSPGLVREPDRDAFAEHFASAPESGVVTFSNIGGDALLVVPCPRAPASAYGHLAAFVRLAPEEQQPDLWMAVSSAMRRRIGRRPVWLSTAGAGVAWLHVRLDDRPKYYGYVPYWT